MKKVILISLFLLSMMFTVCSFAKTTEQALDQLVAIVNDDVITKTELNHAMIIAKMQITQEQLPMPTDADLQKQVLDQIINKKLQIQLAKQAGIEISTINLNQAIEHVAKENNMSVNTLYEHVNQTGMSTSDYRNEIRDQLTMQKLQQQEIVTHINISPHEVDRFLQTKAWKNKNTTNEYRLEDILIPFSDKPSTQEITSVKKHATAILTKLHQGESFEEITRSQSSELQGGDLGWRKLSEIPAIFAVQIAHMHPKEIAGPIQAPNGLHIIRLADVRPITAPQSPPNRKQVEEFLFQKKFADALQTWLSKLRSQAFIVTNP